jgi:hypothetical protein
VKVIYRGRQTGKTTELIELCHEAEQKGECSYIVCATQKECDHIFRKAKEMDKPIPLAITFNDFVMGNYFGQNIRHFFIDDIDRLLIHLSRVHVAAVTISKGEYEDY